MSDTDDRWTEPRRMVSEHGQIVYSWPPQGRFVGLWERLHKVFSDEEKGEVLSLLVVWRDENSTLECYTDEDGNWVDVLPDWDVPTTWLEDK